MGELLARAFCARSSYPSSEASTDAQSDACPFSPAVRARAYVNDAVGAEFPSQPTRCATTLLPRQEREFLVLSQGNYHRCASNQATRRTGPRGSVIPAGSVTDTT